MIKKWLKKVKNDEIKNLLKDKPSIKKIYSVPLDLDREIKNNLKKISEEISIKKKKYNIFFTPRLAFGYAFIILAVFGTILYFNPKSNISKSIKNIFTDNPIVKLAKEKIFIKKDKINQCLITYMKGKAYLVDEQYKTLKELQIGLNIGENDTIKTEKESIIELQIGDDSIVRVKENSILKVVKLFKDQDLEETKFHLDIGKILAKPKNLTEGSSFEIETNSITAGVRGTMFTVSKTEKGISKIAVNEGEVKVIKNIRSININKIKEIDNTLAESLNDPLQKEIVLKKDEKVEISDEDFNNYKEETLNKIDKISEDLEENKNSKEELEKIIKEVEEKTLKEIQNKSDKIIIKENVTDKEWRDDFNRDEFREIGNMALSKIAIEEKKVEIKKEQKIEIVKKEEKKVEIKEEQKKERIELPQIYKNNFDKEPKEMSSDNEWGIIVDNDNNHVLAPVNADINSDAFFRIKETDDFILQFRFKRFPNKDNACWIAIDLGVEKENIETDRNNDWILPANSEISFGNRTNDKLYISNKYNFEFDKWYILKIIVKEGKRFNIYINNILIISYNKLNKDTVKYKYIKFEGQPAMGKWYLDDLYFEDTQKLK